MVPSIGYQPVVLSKPLPALAGKGVQQPQDSVVISSTAVDYVDHLQRVKAPGTLYVLDNFAEDLPVLQGQLVTQAARGTGFQGNLVRLDSTRKDRIDPAIDAWCSAQNQQEMEAAIDKLALSSRVGLLRKVTFDVLGLIAAGVTRSTLNLSLGCGLAGSLAYLLKVVTSSGDPENHQKTDDLKRRIAPRLIAILEETESHPDVRAAKAHYDLATRLFTARHNCIVVAAGNEQRVAEDLGISLPEKFQVNDLTNSQTIVVGALHQGEVAEYSSRYPAVQIYANGELADKHGTSLAAPRVAAMLAHIQGQGKSAPRAELCQHYCIRMQDGHHLKDQDISA